MADLVKRLRKGVRRMDLKPADNNFAERALAVEAADEIERLREQLALHAQGWRDLRKHVDNQDMTHETFRVQAGKAAEHYIQEPTDGK